MIDWPMSRRRGSATGERKLLGEMLVQAWARRDIGLEIGRLAILAAAAGAGPGRRGKAGAFERLARRRGGHRRALGLEGVAHVGAEVGGKAGGVDRESVPRPVALLRLAGEILGRAGVELRGEGFGGLAVARRRVVAVLRLEQRIALQLLMQKGGKFHVGKLQELDRLQELGGHDQGLALAHHQLGRHRHLHTARKSFDAFRRQRPPRRWKAFQPQASIAACFLLIAREGKRGRTK